MQPKTTFISNLNTESERVIHAYLQTQNGFYSKNNFTVLPYLVSQDSGTVYLPHIEILQDKNVAIKIQKIEEELPLKIETDLLNQIKAALLNQDQEIKQVQLTLESEWKKIQKLFWKEIFNLIFNISTDIKEIEIRITSFGSICSFSRHISSEGKITCYIRTDAGISGIAEAIISTLIQPLAIQQSLHWTEKESLVDFLLYKLQQKNIIPQPLLTLPALRKDRKQLQQESDTYLEKLGIKKQIALQYKDNSLYYNAEPLDKHFTTTQRKVLIAFIQNNGKLITYDRLGEIIWEKNQDYTLWALNKQIHRIRTKLQQLTDNKVKITTTKKKAIFLFFKYLS